MTDHVCECGHSIFRHDGRYGCLTFLCCRRDVNTFVGRRHTEHDGADHRAKRCQCKTFVQQKSRWEEDMEAGAIG